MLGLPPQHPVKVALGEVEVESFPGWKLERFPGWKLESFSRFPHDASGTRHLGSSSSRSRSTLALIRHAPGWLGHPRSSADSELALGVSLRTTSHVDS